MRQATKREPLYSSGILSASPGKFGFSGVFFSVEGSIISMLPKKPSVLQ